ncbi:uncharacterized protein [Dysidea avara]|uniref:uncharacterized protein n=1 Tax=Dysidea avara TaxID=196820 RepID=UPI003320D8B9
MSTASSLLTLLVFTAVATLVDADNTILYVRPLNGSTQPCPEPCISLFNNVSQLDDLLSSGTVLKFLPGVHVLDQIIELWNKTDVSFFGDTYDGEISVTIACSVSTSISFVNCSNITIRDVTLDHCSNVINTSYMDALFAENYWYRFPLVPQAALIFVHCFSTTLHNLLISESPGFGVIGINMLGHTKVELVTIRDSGYFFCSTIIGTDPSKVAGGIFLLFQNTPSNLSGSNNSFTVTDSTFSSSCSPSILYQRNVSRSRLLNRYVDAVDLIGSGGVSTIFGQNLYLLTLNIENSLVENNKAYYHAGLNFIYYTGVSSTNVSINNCSFKNNIMNSQSFSLHGTVAVSYATRLMPTLYLKPGRSFQQLPLNLYKQNEFIISDCMFINNTSTESSGISFLSTDEDHPFKVVIENILFTRNLGLVSSALTLVQLEASAFIFDISIHDCMFINNSLVITDSVYNTDQVNYYRYASVVALHNIQQATFTGSTVFKGNLGSSIFLYNSVATFNGVVDFSDNFATLGGGLGIYSNSYILLHEGTNVSFINNVARRRGGAVYVEDVYGVPSRLTRLCSFQYLSSQDIIDEIINIHIYFANNSAGEAGNSIFSSTLDFCSWAPNTAYQEAASDVVNNRIFSFADIDKVQRSSDAFRVCFCSPTNPTQNIITACVVNGKEYSTSVYPGEIINITVIGTGINYDPVPTIIYTTVADTSTTPCSINGVQQIVHQLSNNCTTLYYTVTSINAGVCDLTIRTNTRTVDNPSVDAIVHVEVFDCPFGFVIIQNGECICHPFLTASENPAKIASCNLTTQTFKRPANSWLLATDTSDFLTEIIARDSCPYGYCKSSATYFPLTDPDSQCRYKRSGILCGQCHSGYSSVFGSPQCKICSNAWLSLLVLFALIGIILVVIFFVLNFTITNGTIYGLIFYANVISINSSTLFPQDGTYRPLLTFISFLNLDLGIETCFYDGMDEYAKIWLEYVFPVYLIIIVVVIIVLTRHSSRIQRLVQSNGVPVLSTLIFLSYAKLLRTSSVVLFYGVDITHIPGGRSERVWAPDANVEYFGFKFSILFAVSLLVFTLIVIPFTILLLFTKPLLRFRWITKLTPILDAYQSPFANPFRFWVGFRLLIRALLFSTSALDTEIVLLINAITLSGLAIIQGYLRPFRNFYCNLWDLSFLLNLAVLFSVSQYFGDANVVMVEVLVGISLVKFGALLCYHHITRAINRNRMDQIKNSKMFSKVNTALNNSGIFIHLSMTNQEDVKLKPTTTNANAYSEMREPLVLEDDTM